MAKSDYITYAEENEKKNLSEGYLVNQFIDKLSESEGALFLYAKDLSRDIQTYKDQAVEAERSLWEKYVANYRAWFLKYRDDLGGMEANMNKPNKPHYKRANND